MNYDDDDALPELLPQIDSYIYIESHRNNYRYLPVLFPENRRLPLATKDRYDLEYFDGSPPLRYKDYIKDPVIMAEEAPPVSCKDSVAASIVAKLGKDMGRSFGRAWSIERAYEYLEKEAPGERKKFDRMMKRYDERMAERRLEKKIEHKKQRTIEEIFYSDLHRTKEPPRRPPSPIKRSTAPPQLRIVPRTFFGSFINDEDFR